MYLLNLLIQEYLMLYHHIIDGYEYLYEMPLQFSTV